MLNDYLLNLWDVLRRPGHRLMTVYLVINAAFATWILGSVMTEIIGHPAIGLPLGFVLYVLSLCVALSPLGEAYLRWSTGSRRIKRADDINRVEPAFARVSEKAIRRFPAIPSDVTCFIDPSEKINAFATGRKTICVTRGLLLQDPRTIEAVIAHEYGHLEHKDTDVLLLVTVGNAVVNVFFFILKLWTTLAMVVCCGLGGAAGDTIDDSKGDGAKVGGGLGLLIGKGIQFAFYTIPWWIWTKFGALCVLRASRNDEYKADEFAFNLGYGNELCALLDGHMADSEKEGFFAMLQESHPPADERIAYLQKLGTTYRKM